MLDPELCKGLLPTLARLPQLLERASAEDLAFLAAGLSNTAGLQEAGPAQELAEGALMRLHSMLAGAGNSCQVRGNDWR